MSSEKLFLSLVPTFLLWFATGNKCYKKLVTILESLFIIGLEWSRCVFCKKRVSLEKSTIQIVLANIWCKVLTPLPFTYGTGTAPCMAIAAVVFGIFCTLYPCYQTYILRAMV